MHYGYLILLSLLGTILVAGRSIRKRNAEMQSVIENLLEALSKYSSDISNDGVPNIPCTEQFENSGKDGHADHKATYQNLVEYQKHVEALDQLPRRDSLVEAAVINQDLLQHLCIMGT
ncbi:uncharacterized protein LOC144984647 [Oryzias latipes]